MTTLARAVPGIRGERVARRKRLGRTRRLLVHLAIIVVGFVMLYPLLWMLVSSFKPTESIFNTGLFNGPWTISNYAQGWVQLGYPFTRFFLNSFLLGVLAAAGNLLSCSLAAFAFARLNFGGKKLFFALMLGTIMLPFHVTIVPQYIMFHWLGWVNTFLPIVLPKFLAVDGFFVFLMVQFIRGLPRELDEAARIDGCNSFGIFWRIIIPLMRPALAVAGVFSFIWSYNEFFSPLLYLTNQKLFTIPLALNSFLDSTGESNWGPMFAMAVLSLLPLFVVFLVAQKHLVQGIATTGIK
jgi:multiple sugar transport system permease protein